MGRETIIDTTKLKVLPNPDAPCLTECNKNSAKHVLAAAIYSKLEHKFFDNTHSRMEVSTAFHCNVSQLSKALTGVEYHSGPHHYKLKSRESRKRSTKQGEPSDAPQPKKTSTASTSTVPQAPQEEDTLSSSSSSDLPPAF